MEGHVTHPTLVAGAGGRAAPRGLGGEVEAAEAGRVAAGVGPALEVLALLPHGHTPLCTGPGVCAVGWRYPEAADGKITAMPDDEMLEPDADEVAQGDTDQPETG